LVGYTPSSHNRYDTLSYIPAITLRGALATPILEKFCKNQENEFGKCQDCLHQDDCEFYKFFYKDIFSLTNGLFLSNVLDKKCCEKTDIVPSHPLIQDCKVCGENSKHKAKSTKNKLKEWQRNRYTLSDCTLCDRKTTMKPIEKNYCANCNRILGSPERGTTTSTSINHIKGSSLTEYLFHYNYLQPGSIFQGYLLFKKNLKILNFLKNLSYLRVGRGKSRGFGKVKLKLEEIEMQEKIERSKQLIRSMMEENSIITVAKSHIFSLDIDLNQDLILISNPVIDLNLALQNINKQLNLNLSNINDLFSINRTLGKIDLISGWSLKTQQPKPHIKAAVPGSIYLFALNKKEIDESIIEGLAYLEFIGLNKYSRLGYNLIYFPSFEEIKNT